MITSSEIIVKKKGDVVKWDYENLDSQCQRTQY